MISGFIDEGIPKDVAENIIAQANKFKKSEFRKGGLKTIVIGVGLLALGGVLVNPLHFVTNLLPLSLCVREGQ